MQLDSCRSKHELISFDKGTPIINAQTFLLYRNNNYYYDDLLYGMVNGK